MDEYYVIRFPNPGDGTAFSKSDQLDMEEMWHQMQDMKDAGVLVAVERIHQHQFLPWLTLPNGSSWTTCASCDWQYQYDH